ncbi:hypothetical protein M409DRAFT_63188 [Zasmidium cellare ATCC 36951]|uniref:Ras-GEF domain-containing protein n=1 Tax=Zasmidium cellare ATCC 36951 TaxID=1080233 RepID=A0A6A6D331_ZASCE|nr:uncharacterized protein M409DRAFT_63188 [Zasmidium cellare ATCC 36951]KAF2172529.1 hypothetical protein M409DRAFT_63188 [Zasmidium cellare ATCC 36951]
MSHSTSHGRESSSRRTSKTAYDSQRFEQRREKAKSSQSFAQYQNLYQQRADGLRRGSLRPANADPDADELGSNIGAGGGVGDGGAARAAASERPRLKARTNSAPLVTDRGRLTGGQQQQRRDDDESRRQHRPPAPTTTAPSPNIDVDGQDEDETLGVVGAIRQFHPFQTPELSEPLPEINIAVIGAEGVGKSTFLQNALELPSLPPSQVAERKIPIDGSLYLVRLLELPIEDLDIDDDETINWPDTIEDKMMPRVDGALALYDVKDKASVDELPEMLTAITKASLPTILVSCKCDTPPSERELDPEQVEKRAKDAIASLGTLQISEIRPESHKRGIFMILNNIINSQQEEHLRSSSASRRRAQSSAVRPVSPRHSGPLGHSRASSEYTGRLLKDQSHYRHDSTIAGHTSNDRLRVPQDDQMNSSFFIEESASEASRTSSRSSVSGEQQALAGATPSSGSFSEQGATFDELVERLLAQPTSKADLKFAAIFLALYRKFAAPGKLLEAVVERFDALERGGVPQIFKTQTQLRYVNLLEQWVGWYPGDFAYPKTKRRLRTFISKLAELRIFASAAREISVDIENVREDDDTNWAFTDKEREISGDDARNSMSSTASTLIDDPMFSMEHELSGSTINEDGSTDHLPKFANQMMAHVEQAQRQAQLLEAVPRNPLSKVQWRALMEIPDDLIARELTRMDWIMFSSIRPRDLVRNISLSKDMKAACKNVVHVNRMTDHFNQLACWVANYVLLRDKPKHRALMLEKFMRVARKLRELNNYNALGAIIAGVKSTSVHRLGATKELLPQAVGKDWMKLEILMSPSRSYFAYRLAWENSSSERIPYLPLHRRDLAAAEEGNRTFTGDENEGRINWKKFEIMGDVIVSLQRAQGMPYTNLGGPKGNDQVRELILDVKLIKDEEDLYELSLQREPAAGTSGGPSAKFREFFKR